MSKSRLEGSSYLGHSRVVVEPNLEDLPWALVSNANQGRGGVIRREWEETYADSNGRERTSKRFWEVRASIGLGLPGRMEQDVYVALLELLELRGGMPEDRVLWFSLYELLVILGWSHGGDHYERLRAALRCISSTTIDSRKAFYNPRLKTLVSDNFQLFTVHFYDAEDADGNRVRERNHIIFHPYFADSYRESYEGRLDTAFYWTLRSHVARRLYRLLDRRAAERPEGGARSWEAELFEVRDLIPLANYSRVAKVRQVLERDAHKELCDKGFLRSINYREEKIGRTKKVYVRYRLSSAFDKRTFTRGTELTDVQRNAAEQLRAIGVNRSVAEDLSIKHGPEHCLHWLNLLHQQDRVDWKRAPGLLVSAIRDEPEWWEEVADKKKAKGATPQAHSRDGEARDCAEPEADESSSDGKNRQVDPAPDPNALVIWDQVLEGVSEQINAPSLRVWFEGAVPISHTDDSLTISVPNTFAKEYIESRFLELLEGVVSNLLSPTSSLVIVVDPAETMDNTEKET